MPEKIARGLNFIYAREFIKGEYGEEVWARILRRLPAADAAVWNGVLLLSESYPFSAFKAMTYAMSKELGSMTDKETAKLYEYMAEHSLNKLYKFFFRMANPSYVIKNYPKLWGRFFNAGTVEVPRSERGQADVSFKLPEIFLDWLDPACYGYSKKAIELAAGRNLRMKQVEKRQIEDDLWEISYHLDWDE